MARYRTQVRTERTAQEAFAYLADLHNFAEWDPGVVEVAQVSGDGAGADAAFDVTVKGIGGDLTLRYETVEHVPPRFVRVVARSRFLTSDDRITVEPVDGAIVVTYEADLTLNGPLRIADPLLGPPFRRIGDRAAAGLRRALGGVTVP